MPCGIVLAKRSNVSRISVEIDYISARDQTISGSRNGHTPMMLWAAIKSRPLPELHYRGVPQPVRTRVQQTRPGPIRRRGPPDHHAHHHDSQRLDRLIDDIIQDLGAVTAPAGAAMSAA